MMVAGCAECELDLAVSRHGSGVMTVQALAAPADLDRIQPLVPALRSLGLDMSLTETLWASQDPSLPIPTRALENFARMFGPDLRLERVVRASEGGKSGIRAVFRTDHVSKLRWMSPGNPPEPVQFNFVPGRAPIFRMIPPRAVDSRPASGSAAGGSIRAMDGLIGAAMAPFRGKVTVTVDGKILQTSAARRAGPSSIIIAQADGRRMGWDTLRRLASVKRVSDARGLSAQPPAGVFLEDPSQPLVIRFA